LIICSPHLLAADTRGHSQTNSFVIVTSSQRLSAWVSGSFVFNEIEYHAFDLGFSVFEVDQKANLYAGGLQVVQQPSARQSLWLNSGRL
jgi:hypothetical protein